MTGNTQHTHARPRATGRARTAAALLAVALGLASCAALARWMESRRPAADSAAALEESLYVQSSTARRMSLGFNGLVADWYWMRALQYVGRKVIAYDGRLHVDDLSALNLKMLAPLLEQTTSVDPQFVAAYEYGAVVLPAVDKEAAVRLVQKGIEANPDNWKLYHHLGYIRWQLGQFREAGEAYRGGARRPGAPRWMEAMAARMEAEGGDRTLAREMFARMYEESEDGQIKEMALKRLAQLRSFDERDAVRRVLAAFRQQVGRCPANWGEVAPVLRRVLRVEFGANGAPLDPLGTPYVLVQEGCDVDLDPASKVPYK